MNMYPVNTERNSSNLLSHRSTARWIPVVAQAELCTQTREQHEVYVCSVAPRRESIAAHLLVARLHACDRATEVQSHAHQRPVAKGSIAAKGWYLVEVIRRRHALLQPHGIAGTLPKFDPG